MPVAVKEIGNDLQRGPALVTVEYSVPREWKAGFLAAIHKYGHMRFQRHGWQMIRGMEQWKTLRASHFPIPLTTAAI